MPARDFQLPATGSSLTKYLAAIRGFPMMKSREEEFALARRYKEHGDLDAARRIITAHLRWAAKIASQFSGYGFPFEELIAAGNVGLLEAMRGFEPDRGFRFTTYSSWWIRANIQEEIIHGWSLVKMGTAAAQRTVFFNLRKLKGQLQAYESGDLSPENVKKIAVELGVKEADVIAVNRRLAGPDESLNEPYGKSLDGKNDGERQDFLVDEDRPNPEESLVDRREYKLRSKLFHQAIKVLTEREYHIFTERRLREDPPALEDLVKIHKVSRERIRQIEVEAFEKVQGKVKELQRASYELLASGALEREAIQSPKPRVYRFVFAENVPSQL